MALDQIWLIIAVILSLPGGLFVALLVSEPRARWASVLGGIIGAVVVALGVYAFVQMANVHLDILSYVFGVFFASSIGVALGALVMNFLIGLGSRNPHSSMEY